MYIIMVLVLEAGDGKKDVHIRDKAAHYFTEG
jgi:hypothetical protein